MVNEDIEMSLSPFWCPLCGDPRSVCDAYGDCARIAEEDKVDRDYFFSDLDDDEE